ncbi:MAG TPA: heat-inducible transcriptional repressor HrcA [Gaiellaceae bacterium]|jgi:heat-inducible transcriptional repressor|nr:heat-inducible transcriptional repressor HrcA [Gaiellaceae bacterium]
MANQRQADLSPRQRALLRGVVEQYVATGAPVGSKTLVEHTGIGVSPSTVRAELAELEALGLLTHPHTSAGRVPTEAGYRYYADGLLERLEPNPRPFPLDLSAAQAEVDAALQATTEMLSDVTRLLALVSAPPLESASIRHVEVLLLQAQVVMVVVITSTGAVTKRVYAFADPVDPGLVNWAGQYLNDTVTGLPPGTRQLRQRFEDSGLSEREAVFLATLRPAFTDVPSERQNLYVGGAASLVGSARGDELDAYRRLLEVLEERAALLGIVSQALDPRRPFIRVGVELEHPDLQRLSLVGAAYGVANRTLGAVSLLGPVRMDYETAIRSVRGAASELSRFVEEIYENN